MSEDVKKNKDDKKEKGKGSKKIIFILLGIVLAAVLVGGAVFGGYYLASKTLGTGAAATESKKKEEDTAKTTLAFEQQIINLADENKSKYIKLTIVAEYNTDDKFAEELTTKTPALRDIVNNTFRSKTSDEITAATDTAIKKELLDKMNAILNKGQLTNVYFSDIVIQ